MKYSVKIIVKFLLQMLNVLDRKTDIIYMRNNDYTGIITSINTNCFYFMQTMILSMQNKLSNNSSNMETEIFQQPYILEFLAKKYITPEKYILINLPLNIKKVVLIASGSSYNCAHITAEVLKESANCDAECIYSSEFSLNRNITIDKDTLYVFISQSGETTDTLDALKHVIKSTDKTLCITNNDDSTIWQLSNYKILTCAGKEHSIASTKAVSAQLFCSYLLVLKIMYSKNIDIQSDLNYLYNLPTFLKTILEDTKSIKAVAKKLSKFNTLSILGSRAFYALAKEGALKIKETSYINTTGYPQGEFMHGHVAVLNHKSAVISLIDSDNEAFCIKNLQRIKDDYKPFIVALSNNNSNGLLDEVSDHNFRLNAETKIFTLFGDLLILQLLALEIAKQLKRNIDRPKGLRKVVIN